MRQGVREWFAFPLLATVAFLGASPRDDSPSPGSEPLGGGPRGGVLADVGPAPEIALIDQDGRPFRLETLRGKAVLVSFIYTTCTGSCPATTFGLTRVREALKEAGLWGSDVAFVSVTLDPRRDTPEVLKSYARIYDAQPESWHFLTGPESDVAQVIQAWGMWAKVGPTGVLDHPSRIFLVDPKGRQREIYNLSFLKPSAVTEDVRLVLVESED
ncbi:MAG: SCO family protein [Isosphaeraceae bacterium]